MAYETYLAELEALRAGADTPRTPVKISVQRSYIGQGKFERGLATSDLHIAVFPATAGAGARATIVVHVDPLEELDHIESGTSAVAIGTLAIGHAVAVQVDGRMLLPSGPADRPAFRVPKL